jgi:hypothetical protein
VETRATRATRRDATRRNGAMAAEPRRARGTNARRRRRSGTRRVGSRASEGANGAFKRETRATDSTRARNAVTDDARECER